MKHSKKIAIIKSLHKEAFDLNSLTDMFVSSLKSLIDPNHPIESVLQLIAEGFIASKFGFIGGIVAAVLNMFGINIGTLWNLLSSHLGVFIHENKNNQFDINQAASQIANQTVDSLSIPQDAANQPMMDVVGSKHNNGIVKEAAGGIGGFALTSLLKSIIKAALIGAGYSTATGMIGSAVGFGAKPSQTKKPETPISATQIAPIKQPQNTILNYVGNPSSEGEIYHRNTADLEETSGYAWYLTGDGNFNRYMYEWIFDVYPEMPDNIETIVNKYYPRAISQIKREFSKWNPEINIDTRGENIRVPQSINGIELHTIKDIVDLILSMFAIK
jgi:hypothetical protein